VRELIDGVYAPKSDVVDSKQSKPSMDAEPLSEKDLAKRIKQLEKQMLDHARGLEFEQAARVRDQLALLREQAFGAAGSDNVAILTPRA
jgi:excinuclease ABC subunit B